MEDRLSCCLTLSFSEFVFPSESHLLRQLRSQVQEEREGGVGDVRRKILLTERQKLGEKEPGNAQNARMQLFFFV